MNEVDLIRRLKRELESRDRWPQIERVVTRRSAPAIPANELHVYLSAEGRSPRGPAALRVLVEPLPQRASRRR